MRPWLAELSRRQDIDHIQLGPFSRSELAQHLAAVRGEPLPAAAVDRILARSEGNPFYAEELLAVGADPAAVLLPWSLAEVLLGRVEGLTVTIPYRWHASIGPPGMGTRSDEHRLAGSSACTRRPHGNRERWP